MWGSVEDENEDTGEEEMTLRPDVILARSSRRDNSADFPSCISPLKVHSGAAAGAVRGPISSGEFGLWRGSFPGSLPVARRARAGSWSDLEIISGKNMEKFTVGDCGEAAIPNHRLVKSKMRKG